MTSERVCSVEGCGKPFRAQDLCNMHYKRAKNAGELTRRVAEYGAGLAFLTEALSTETGDCIIWPFPLHRSGYSQVRVDGVDIPGHRYVCEKAHGPPPDPSLQACHGCGRRACVNKRHLRWGTAKENADDKVIHGTIVCGSETHNSKLTESEIPAIRAAYPAKSASEIARQYGVHHSSITSILRGETWRHV